MLHLVHVSALTSVIFAFVCTVMAVVRPWQEPVWPLVGPRFSFVAMCRRHGKLAENSGGDCPLERTATGSMLRPGHLCHSFTFRIETQAGVDDWLRLCRYAPGIRISRRSSALILPMDESSSSSKTVIDDGIRR